jgi:hypothetical protein
MRSGHRVIAMTPQALHNSTDELPSQFASIWFMVRAEFTPRDFFRSLLKISSSSLADCDSPRL